MLKSLPDLVGTVVRNGRCMSLFDDGTLLPLARGGDHTATLEREIVELGQLAETKERERAAERAKADQVLAELRASGADLSKDKDAFEKLDAAYRSADSLADEVNELRTRRTRLMEIDNGERRSTNPDPLDHERPESRSAGVGARFASSPSMVALRASGKIQNQGKIETDPEEVMTREATRGLLRQRTTIDTSNAGGLIPIDQQVFPPEAIPVRQPLMLDLITIGDTDSDQINWTKQTTRTNNAAPTAFGTAAPESAYAWTIVNTPVVRIPHFVPATKDVLADQGQLRTLIDSELMDDLRLVAENQVVNGDGAGQNFRGIVNTSGIATQAKGADTYLDAAHKLITAIRLGIFRDPNFVGLHPTDYQQFVLAKDSQGNYLFRMGEPTSIWGLTPIVSPVFAQGTGVIGYGPKATMWLRAGVAISVSDSHSDYFTKEMVAILATMRAGFAVKQPKAFGTLTGL